MSERSEFLILGCGYTAGRVARKLILDGDAVVCTNRLTKPMNGVQCVALDAANAESLADLTKHLSPGMIVLHSIPPAGDATQSLDYTFALLETLRPFAPRRFVYISTTGVYGPAQTVDEQTPVAPATARDQLRVQAENLIAAGPWSHLILRPAAIYGPNRGVHASVQRGTFSVPEDGRIISRIHVDDLAEQVAAGLRGELTGAFPIADEEPCPSIDIAVLTSRLLGLLEPRRPETNESVGRRVDGSAFRRLSGTRLQYPTYRQGVPACLPATL